MAGPYLTGAELITVIEQGLKKAIGSLKDYWTGIANRCVIRGWNDLKNVLLAKGYTVAQLEAWDDRRAYNEDQALFWAYTEGGGPSNEEQANYKRFDRVAWFQKQEPGAIALSVNGVMVTPGATGEAAVVGSGSMTLYLDGINAGTTFGLKSQRRNGMNQFGDVITEYD